MNWINRAADTVLERLAPSHSAEGACIAACSGIIQCFLSPCDNTYNGLYRHCTLGSVQRVLAPREVRLLVHRRPQRKTRPGATVR